MKRKSRLSRSERAGRRDRLTKDNLGLHDAVSDITKMHQDAHADLMGDSGEFAEPEVTREKEHLKTVYGLIKNHPDESLMLRVELEEPPEGTAGNFVCRADDFVHFSTVDVEDIDSGHVFRIPRRSISKIVGTVTFETSPVFEVGGYGMFPQKTEGT